MEKVHTFKYHTVHPEHFDPPFILSMSKENGDLGNSPFKIDILPFLFLAMAVQRLLLQNVRLS
jgi:hypothetical protein